MNETKNGLIGSFGVAHIVALVFTLAIGIGIGWLTAPRTENSQASRGDQGAKPAASGKNGGVSMDDSRSLPGRHRSKASALSRPSADTVTLSAEALGALAKTPGMPRLGDDGLFFPGDPVVKSLGITESEKLHLEEFWNSAIERIRQEETARAKVKKNQDGSVSISIPPHTELRVSMFDDFADKVKREMDPNRGAALLAAKGSGQLLADSGQTVEYKVTTTSSDKNGWSCQIEKTSGGKKEVWMGDSIPARFQHLADLAGVEAGK
jgi:hypothetical protein